jgi:hypothetical protein
MPDARRLPYICHSWHNSPGLRQFYLILAVAFLVSGPGPVKFADSVSGNPQAGIKGRWAVEAGSIQMQTI